MVEEGSESVLTFLCNYVAGICFLPSEFVNTDWILLLSLADCNYGGLGTPTLAHVNHFTNHAFLKVLTLNTVKLLLRRT